MITFKEPDITKNLYRFQNVKIQITAQLLYSPAF